MRSESKRAGSTRRRAKDPQDVIGREGLWTVQLQVRSSVTVRVKITNARPLFGRMDLEIETNTGDRAWVSDRTVRVL